MKYKVYFSDRIDKLQEPTLIGTAETIQDACKLLRAQVGYNQYWRFLFCADAVFIDYGSYSKFGAITPPFTIEELNKES